MPLVEQTMSAQRFDPGTVLAALNGVPSALGLECNFTVKPAAREEAF
ncbi:hypothetical protein AB4Y35_28930 [Paraburkholderia sp. EG286A]